MTVASAVSRVSYSGNGSTTAFAVPFYFLENAHLRVILRSSAGVETVQTITTNYTVTGAGNPAGGTVNMIVAPASGETLVILRDVPETQETDYTANDPFPAESHERALDKLTMIAQQIGEESGRAIKIPETETSNTTLPVSATRANKLLGFSSGGDVALSNSTITQVDAAVSSFVNATGNNAASILYDPAGSGAVQTTVQAKLHETVSVKDFGAVGDGVADDTAAIQAAIDYVAALGITVGVLTYKNRQNGGSVYFPGGTYKTTSEIVMPPGNVRLVGNNRKTAYPGPIENSAEGPATILGVHSDRNLFTVSNASTSVFSIHASNINFATLETGSVPTAAFGFDCTPGFHRDFTFERCGIYGFTSAFDVYKSGGGNNQMGVIKIVNCAINRNDYIARTLNATQWNSFVFQNNEAGQNTVGGIDIAAQATLITGNLLEGQPNPIKISGGSYRGIIVQGNYFESNTGTACVWFDSVNHGLIGHNFYGGTIPDYKAYAFRCVAITANDPVFFDSCVSCKQYDLASGGSGGIETKITYPTASAINFSNIARLNTNQTFALKDSFADSGWATNTTDKWANNQTVLARTETITTNSKTFNATGLTANAGDFIVTTIPIKFADTPSSIQTTTIINGTGYYGATYILTNRIATSEWYTITVAARALTSVSSFSLLFYPYGISYGGSSDITYMRPTFFVCSDPSQIQPLVDLEYAASANQYIEKTNNKSLADTTATNFFTFTKSAGSTDGHRSSFGGKLLISLSSRTTAAKVSTQTWEVPIAIGCGNADNIALVAGTPVQTISYNGGGTGSNDGTIAVSLVSVSNTSATLAVTWTQTAGTYGQVTAAATLIGSNEGSSESYKFKVEAA